MEIIKLSARRKSSTVGEMKILRVVLLSAALLLMSAGKQTVIAQGSTGYYGPNYSSSYGPLHGYISGMTWRKSVNLRSRMRRPSTGTSQPRGDGKTSIVPAPKNASVRGTTFTPVTPFLTTKELAKRMAKSPQDVRLYEEAFKRYLHQYQARVESNGGAPNDAARALSFFLIAQYAVGAERRISDAEAQAVREDVRQMLLEDRGFQALSDRAKQQMFEGMVIIGEFALTAYEFAEHNHDRPMKQKVSQAARKVLESFLETPFANISITNEGIRLR